MRIAGLLCLAALNVASVGPLFAAPTPEQTAKFTSAQTALKDAGKLILAKKYEEAVQTEKDAIQMASALKWDTASMEQRLSSYEQRKPWYGELVTLVN